MQLFLSKSLVVAGLAAALTLPPLDPLAAAEGFEVPSIFQASEILPASLLSGRHHRVREEITNDGYINRYVIDSIYGPFSGVTSAKLRKRIREIEALSAMTEIRGTKIFRDSVVEAGGDIIGGVKSFVTSPIDTVTGAVSGVGKAFARFGENIFGSKRSDAEDRRWKSIIGFSKTKREYAYDFGIDVYTTNQVVQDELDKIAWAGYTGGMTVAGLMTAVPGAAGIATSVTGGSRLMNEVYRTTSPADLRLMNREKLLAIGVNEDLTEVFLDNAVFSPRQQTDFVFALEDMDGVAGRNVLVKFAVNANDRDIVFFRQRMAQMYAAYHKTVAPIHQFLSLGRDTPIKALGLAQNKSGVVIFHAPLDYLVWTEPMARIFGAIDAAANAVPGSTGKELWLAGGLSTMARKNIEAAGWKVFQDQEIALLGDLEGAKDRISYK